MNEARIRLADHLAIGAGVCLLASLGLAAVYLWVFLTVGEWPKIALVDCLEWLLPSWTRPSGPVSSSAQWLLSFPSLATLILLGACLFALARVRREKSAR